MDFSFEEEGPDGTIKFSGSLDKMEIDWLLRYALVNLLHKGALPFQVINDKEVASYAPVDPDHLMN